MKTKERLDVLNLLRVELGQKPLKNWKQSRAKLEERIQAADVELAAQNEANKAVKPPVAEPEAPSAETEQPVAEPVAENKSRQTAKPGSISSVVKPMIKEGLSNDEIAAKLAIDNPELLGTWDEATKSWKQTKKWYISWYRSDMKRKGEL